MKSKYLLNNITKREWLKKQESLKKWRNQIWEERDEAAIKTYLDWHTDFFTRFYQSSSPSHMILDIGCGYMIKNFNQAGKLNRLMEFINSRYIGIDPIGEWFIPIKHSNVEFHIGYGEHLPFEANVFDSVMLLGVLDHVMDPPRVLREAYRVANNSYIEGTRRKVLQQKIYHYLGFDKHHRFAWTENELESLVSKVGFYPVRMDRCLCDVSFYIEAKK
jgi:SAM-dependent methyltransferase